MKIGLAVATVVVSGAVLGACGSAEGDGADALSEAASIRETVADDAPAPETLDPTLDTCCLHPETGVCGECVGYSYCDACLCYAPTAPISRQNCPATAPECPPPRFVKKDCLQIAAWAKDPVTGLCCYYGVACKAPVDWPQFSTFEECLL
jgi:hypothetical protein